MWLTWFWRRIQRKENTSKHVPDVPLILPPEQEVREIYGCSDVQPPPPASQTTKVTKWLSNIAYLSGISTVTTRDWCPGPGARLRRCCAGCRRWPAASWTTSTPSGSLTATAAQRTWHQTSGARRATWAKCQNCKLAFLFTLHRKGIWNRYILLWKIIIIIIIIINTMNISMLMIMEFIEIETRMVKCERFL